ncbi:hypothetical protein CLOSTHATH_00664 [Hungatella hathewayi DSM 13479]|uniref:Uncharacterized protein n=1 Tax=Hungatella hathewayi DSM 13479 TaxID=566550 RepID=D3AAP3_9FIRM|nr:hypothetical protein CLOSTHATH_00664 [Hungatella hathewayi DSM 13479]
MAETLSFYQAKPQTAFQLLHQGHKFNQSAVYYHILDHPGFGCHSD